MKLTAKNIKVHVSLEAWQSIEHWIGLAGDLEVSGLGLVEKVRDGFFVSEVYLPRQVGGEASTELHPDSVAELMLTLQHPSMLRFWWHYHPRGIGLRWSQTDDDCVEHLRNDDWFVSSVFVSGMQVRNPLHLVVLQKGMTFLLRIQIIRPDKDIYILISINPY